MLILEELETLAYNAFTFLEVELVLKVGDPGIGTGTPDKDKCALFKGAWPQFAGRANGEPVARVTAEAHQRIDHDHVRVGGQERTRKILVHAHVASGGVRV